MKLFFDTETSDGWDFRSTIEAEHQPRLVQLGALVMDDEGKEVACLNAIVKPDGWLISDVVTEIHGISQDRADQCGMPLIAVIAMFNNMAKLCDERIAFNIDFDDKVIAREFLMIKRQNTVAQLTKPYCMMRAMTPICKIPKPAHQRYNRDDPFKWPKLQEAYQFAFNRSFENAHDAISDIRATAELYFWLRSSGQKQPELIGK